MQRFDTTHVTVKDINNEDAVSRAFPYRES